eukprot:652469-Prymnesium_polylepis.1
MSAWAASGGQQESAQRARSTALPWSSGCAGLASAGHSYLALHALARGREKKCGLLRQEPFVLLRFRERRLHCRHARARQPKRVRSSA